MSEEHGSDLTLVSGDSPGEALREAREKYGLSIEEVANELNLSISQIRALEESRFEDLPGKTYVQGYLKSYARLLNSDESDILRNFSQQEDPNISGIRPVITETRRADRHVKLLGIGVVLVLGGLLFAWWQNREQAVFVPLEVGELEQQSIQPTNTEQWPDPDQTARFVGADEIDLPGVEAENYTDSNGNAGPVTVESGAGLADTGTGEQAEPGQMTVEELMPPASEMENAVQEDAGTSEGGGVAQSPQTIAADTPTVASTQTPTQTVVVSPEPETAESGAAAPKKNKKIEVASAVEPDQTAMQLSENTQQAPAVEAGRLVKLKFSDNSWVDLRDANGQRLLYENVTEGREISIQGNPPFSVFLGNAEGVQIDYGGKPFDFSAFTNGVYARFELGLEQRN